MIIPLTKSPSWLGEDSETLKLFPIQQQEKYDAIYLAISYKDCYWRKHTSASCYTNKLYESSNFYLALPLLKKLVYLKHVLICYSMREEVILFAEVLKPDKILSTNMQARCVGTDICFRRNIPKK